jgi:beta-glucosidase-like glycosyl hydrolase/CubicO group peptidase (beta-lactamase class C family)
MNYAPVLDVNNNINNPVINFRSFGEDPGNVTSKGIAYFKGLQDSRVLPTGKHFPGHGDTDVDSHHDLPQINHNWERLNSLELTPFREAIKEGISGLMVAHLNIPALDNTPGLPSTLSANIVNGVLRDSLGFKGLSFTDALNMEGVVKNYQPGEVEVRALEAGHDVLLFPKDLIKALDAIKSALRSGRLKDNTINERCKKVLVTKYILGIHEDTDIQIEELSTDLNKLDYQLLRRELYREAITVIKNERSILPLKRLDTLQIASISLGHGKPDIFQERLSKYTLVDHFQLDKERIEEQGPAILDNLANYNLLILQVDDLSRRPITNYGVTDPLKEFISRVSVMAPTVLVWLNNPYGLSKINGLDDLISVVVSYEENVLTKDFSAQLIFGGLGASGRLPVSISDHFPSGSGEDVEGGLRLSYLQPEEAGLHGVFLRSKIDSIANYALEEGVAPGLQVLIAKDKKVVLHSTYGYHTYDSLKEVENNDIYDLASVTKVSGALPALMQLHDEGKFDLDATLGDYFDYYEKGNKKDIEIRKILSHNAQLEAWIPYWRTTLKKNGKFKPRTFKPDSSEQYPVYVAEGMYLHKDYKDQIYKMIKKSDLLEEPGYVYSGLSFYLWPEIVETITGNDYETYLKNTFYKPLGANTITYNPYKHYELDRIIPTEDDTFFRMMLIHGRVHDEGAAMMDGVSSNAGLFASTNDLAKLMQMYLNMGEYGGERYISKNTLEKFTFCHYCEEDNRRGLAFDKPVLTNKENGSTAINAGDSSFGHSGYTGTFAWMDPESGILFIFMSNRVHPTRENRKLYQLNIRPSMHQAIYDARF